MKHRHRYTEIIGKISHHGKYVGDILRCSCGAWKERRTDKGRADRVKMRALIKTSILAFCLTFVRLYGQDVYNNCPRIGDAKDAKTQERNVQKTRWTFPEKYDTVGFDDFVHAKSGTYDETHGGVLTAYVFNVKSGGEESCECHSKAEEDKDIHITLTKDAKHIQGKDRVICEVTSRFKAMMKVKGVDWSPQVVKKRIYHKYVRLSGFFFWDVEHLPQSYVGNSRSTKVWRGSPLELHPLTNIELVNQK